jgi:hypothetical protein
MNKLTPLGLFLIFLCATAPPLCAGENQVDHMNIQTLIGRSFQPSLAYNILLRSVGASLPAPVPPTPTPQAAIPRFLPNPIEPVKIRIRTPELPPITGPTVTGFSRLSDLHPHVLDRLEKFDSHIKRYSLMNGVDPNLVRALIYVESSGNPKAVSPKGAQGLMQLMPATAEDMGVSNPLDPVQNIFGGTRYIGDLMDQFGRIDLALWAYNAGPQSVKRKTLPLETKKFIPQVMRIKSILDRSGS